MELMPLYAYRDFHSLAHANDAIGQQYLYQDGIFRTVNYPGCPEIFISVPDSTFMESKHWYHNFEYSVEQYRGLDFKEDLYTHGRFSFELSAGSKLGIILSLNDPTGRDPFELVAKEKERRENLIGKFAQNKNLKRLALAADQFIVKRGDLKTIIAGYHWFSDWGRDTMIALPGLCLVTGRFDDAKHILKAFAEHVSEGMLPNRFPDSGEKPEYNTIDATLWFFHAIHLYVQYTGDFAFAQSLLPILHDIMDWHYRGTRYNINVDEVDGLLSGGIDQVQLTWMDAKVGDWVVTPRKGKAVEINALWYNALCILSDVMQKTGDIVGAKPFVKKADVVKANFERLFWNTDLGCLYDYVNGDYKNPDIRPNQIFALSLPHSPLSKEKAKQVLNTVEKHLLTSRGLRSLAPSHQDYQPIYGGSVWQRDGSYHQGTVWSFLLGPYIDALVQVKGESGKKEAVRIIQTFLEHLDEACIGSISEIFDGQAPHHPRGCVAQAWGVGEMLRVIVEHRLL
jgi:predicted glycogen debranching enzyme